MALVKVDFFSQALKRTAAFYALIPNDLPDETEHGGKLRKDGFKTLYLLHGYTGGNTDWLINSMVGELSAKYGLAVIMPSGDNSFYLDAKGTGRAFGQYTGCELVDYSRRLFGLSERRSDTFIGGLSMGGFGALRNALKYNRTFSKVFALSPAIIVNEIKDLKEGSDNGVADYDYYRSVFGDLAKLGESDNNPEYLVGNLLKSGEEIPGIYMTCGTEDFLLQTNREFKSFLESRGVELEYSEDEGTHDWNYWNGHLEPAIQWLLKPGGK